ncbi:MAG: DUF1697 domain-containing protein [Bacteroidetes bacterium]|nr:DUF1697 domain-containing protein [Bacteroidota bacterium]
MKTYIAVLRGINVSGYNVIKMAELKNMFERMKYSGVRTYIQSGNVVFRAGNEAASGLARKISDMISETFGLSVPVLVLDSAALKEVVSGNPFLKDRKYDTKYMHVTMLPAVPEKTKIKELAGFNSGSDEIVFKGSNAYLYCPEGYGRTKLNNTFLEKKLGMTATTRNWRTVCILSEMAGAV